MFILTTLSCLLQLHQFAMRLFALALLSALSATRALAPARGVVSFDLEGVMWDAAAVRSGVRVQLQDFMQRRLRVSALIDAIDEMDRGRRPRRAELTRLEASRRPRGGRSSRPKPCAQTTLPHRSGAQGIGA